MTRKTTFANFLLFAVTVGIYYWAWATFFGGSWLAFGLIALACIPFNTNGNVWTLFGNAVSDRNIYSVWSLYQSAGEKALSLIGFTIFQKGNEAETFVGLVLAQWGEKDVFIGLGLALFQGSNEGDATICGGLALVQGGKRAFTSAGLILFQLGVIETVIGLGAAFVQAFADEAFIGLGLIGLQHAEKKASSPIGITLFRNAGGRNQAFGIFSGLASEPSGSNE